MLRLSFISLVALATVALFATRVETERETEIAADIVFTDDEVGVITIDVQSNNISTVTHDGDANVTEITVHEAMRISG